MSVALAIEQPGLKLESLPRAAIEALYVHVPFCFHKCHYCDFYSITRQTPQRMATFVDLVLREAEIWSAAREVRPRTVFFGGGTPTLLAMEQMARLVDGLRQRFDLSGVEEWTVEANPATVNAAYCEMLRGVGVDRISFGGQSFDRSELAMLERHHNPEDVPRGVEMARQAGFERLNVDLIYGIPGQSLESWQRSLDRAVEMGTGHLSCYGLTYESNTPIAVRKRLGLLQAVEETLELEMMRWARRRLREAGLEPYEISNYARVGEAKDGSAGASPSRGCGEECRHNLVYWTGGNNVGLGPSAASHVEGWRWRNRPHLGEWEGALGRGKLAAIEVEVLSAHQRAGELAWLMLRLARGLSYAALSDRLGLDVREVYRDRARRLVGAGVLDADEGGLRLTEAGIAVADAVGAEFLDVRG